jgi:hypothetical protein
MARVFGLRIRRSSELPGKGIHLSEQLSPVRVWWVPVAGSHTRTVSSKLVVAMRVPSGDHATPVTPLVWPVRVRSSAVDGGMSPTRTARCGRDNRAWRRAGSVCCGPVGSIPWTAGCGWPSTPDADQGDLERWIGTGVAYVRTLPPK